MGTFTNQLYNMDTHPGNRDQTSLTRHQIEQKPALVTTVLSLSDSLCPRVRVPASSSTGSQLLPVG